MAWMCFAKIYMFLSYIVFIQFEVCKLCVYNLFEKISLDSFVSIFIIIILTNF